ncbi:SDR family oxidoreductase [Nocardia carnea]|uniref:SDR family oxidoreductase n=1 Tax=Nocardia carnea TaxID=37328 RepID=A0ABW7TJ94_9NOCA|nr:SDR family oxidoreductase [Nocardia carnea]
MTAGAVLVTGASGLVGAEVVARLAAAGREVVALRHTEIDIVGAHGNRIEVAEFRSGDVRLPGFGLSAGMRRELGARVETIVHCAATTAFDAADSEYAELNVGGTENAIGLALDWDAALVHLSTAYVCGMRGGEIAEDELDCGQSFGTRYEAGKYAAEQAVRGAPGLRWSVVRPGIVTGACDSGAIREYKNLYTVVKLMVEGKLRSLPGRYDATVTLAPVDHVAAVVAAAVLDFETGRTLHAVGRDTLSLREISDVLAEYPSFAVATFVPETTFTESDLDPIEREYYRRIGSLYTSYFTRRQTFGTEHAEALLGQAPPGSGKEYLRLLLDHCLESGYLGDPLPTIEDILTGIGTEWSP